MKVSTWLVAALAVVGVLAACGSGGAGHKDSFCEDLVSLSDTVGQMRDATLTDAEAVDQLAGLQHEFEDDAILLRQDGDETTATYADGLATAVAHMKVAASNGYGGLQALDELNAAVRALPSNFC